MPCVTSIKLPLQLEQYVESGACRLVYDVPSDRVPSTNDLVSAENILLTRIPVD